MESPYSPIRRLSSASSSSRQEDLINAYEAEEERIINVLSRKLEQLREEKIDLENALEAESESHVNRLSRELSALRLAQQPAQAGLSGGSVPDAGYMFPPGAHPSAEAMLDAVRRENEQLRARLVDTERDYVRLARLNDVYREELIEHRRRLGLAVDNLIGLPGADAFAQPTHRRAPSPPDAAAARSPAPPPPPGVPIPRPPSQLHRPHAHAHAAASSAGTTPLSHSPDSPYAFSPASPAAASRASTTTAPTTPPSSAAAARAMAIPAPHGFPARGLSYPSVPPPSLSSSFGSPAAAYGAERPLSPAEARSRRSSSARRGHLDRREAGAGGLRSISRSQSRGAERGGRVAETGSLIRSRAGSQAVAPEAEKKAA